MLISSMIFFFNDTATTEIYTLSLHDALPISDIAFDADPKFFACLVRFESSSVPTTLKANRSEERFSRNAETDLVCRLLLEKKKNKNSQHITSSVVMYRPQQAKPSDYVRSVTL